MMKFSRHLIFRAACAALILAICANASAQQPQPQPQPQSAPAGVRFLQTASTLDELRRNTRADLSWSDGGNGDRAEMFMWVDTSTPDTTFTLDQAHLVQQGGRQFWAFVDVASGTGLDFNDPVQQFMVQRHVRQRVAISDGEHDGNRSFARLLDRRSDGAAVYELGYVSLGGARAHQESVRTYLLYRSPEAVWQLAANDIDADRHTSKIGSHAIWQEVQMRVVWAPAGAAVPFHVELTVTTGHSIPGPESRVGTYETYRKGTLSGAFPMQRVMADRQLLRTSGRDTLLTIAPLLMEYYWSFPEGTPKRQIEDLWIEALRRANPAFDPRVPISSGAEFVIPDESATAGDIARQMREGATAASFDCTKASTPVERTICAEPLLAGLDGSLGAAYNRALSVAVNANAMRERQRQWLSNERNKCADAACIRDAYAQRLEELAAGEGFTIKELLSRAARQAASVASIPVYIPAELPDVIVNATDGCAFTESASSSYTISLYRRLTRYGKSGPLPCEDNAAALVASIHGDANPLPDMLRQPSMERVTLLNGRAGWFRPATCGGSCTLAALYWRTREGSYSIQVRFDATYPAATQRQILLRTGASVAAAGKL